MACYACSQASWHPTLEHAFCVFDHQCDEVAQLAAQLAAPFLGAELTLQAQPPAGAMAVVASGRDALSSAEDASLSAGEEDVVVEVAAAAGAGDGGARDVSFNSREGGSWPPQSKL
jgi:hypothetical protein